MLGDIRIALRAMGRKPWFALTAIAILAVGIGSSTALFSVAYALLLNPLPYPDSRRIVWLWSTSPQQREGAFSRLDYHDIAERQRSFTAVAWIRFDFFHVKLGSEPERIQGAVASSSFSAVMGTPALVGRTFEPGDEAGNPRAVLLSYRLWQERFRGDRGIVSRSLMMNGESFAVVGVMPPEFRFPSWAELWVTPAPRLAGAPPLNRSHRFYWLVGRLQARATVAQASADLQRIYRNLAEEGQAPAGYSGRIVELHERLVGNYRPVVLILLGASALVLAIACASVANLFLARALGRQRDWSLRVALGARLPQLVQPLLAEGLLVSVAGGLLGLAIAGWGVRGLMLAFPNSLPRASEVGLHPWVLAFALAAVLAGTLASGLALLRLSPSRLSEALKGEGRAATGGRRDAFLSALMVTAQISLAVILVAATLLLRKNWEETQNVELGIPRDGYLFFRLSLPVVKYQDARQRGDFFLRATERIAALPGVLAVASSNDPPPGPHDLRDTLVVQDRPAPRLEEELLAGAHFISPGYFQALGIPIREGREFSPRDSAEAPRVVVVNQKLARRFWPGSLALGKRIRLSAITPNLWYEVVGVAGDVRHGGPAAEFGLETYIPLSQHSPAYTTISVRLQNEQADLLPAIKAEIHRLDADLPIFDVYTFRSYIDTWMVGRRFNTTVMHIFGGVALALALAGVFSLLSFRVAGQTREIGVRMALGASRREVLWAFLLQGMRLCLLGTLLGVGGAVAITRMARSMLGEVQFADTQALALASAALAVACLAASWIPAHRATRVDPLIALRYE